MARPKRKLAAVPPMPAPPPTPRPQRMPGFVLDMTGADVNIETNDDGNGKTIAVGPVQVIIRLPFDGPTAHAVANALDVEGAIWTPPAAKLR